MIVVGRRGLVEFGRSGGERREDVSEPDGWVKLSPNQKTSRRRGRVPLTLSRHEETILSRAYLLQEAFICLLAGLCPTQPATRDSR